MDLTVAEISRIKTGTPEEKRVLITHFLGTRSPAGLQLALDALGDEDWTVRKFASEKLAALGAPAIEHLGKALRSGNENQRYWAVKSLVGIGREAVPLLLKILARGPKKMRLHAATALGEIRDPVALPYLVAALGDEVWQVRFNSFQGLLDFGEKALEDLTKGISSDNEDRAYWSAKALGKLGEKARGVLLHVLRSGSRRLRFVVAAALGETGDERVIRLLIQSTNDRSWIVRKRSADALGEIGTKAIPFLIEAFNEEEREQLPWLLRALCKVGEEGVRALEVLILQRGESFAWNIRDALVGLGKAAHPLFLSLSTTDDLDLRFFGVTCLGELPPGPGTDEALLERLRDRSWSIRKVAAEALAARGAAITELLSRALEYGNEDLRYWVTVVFRRMGSAGVDQLLEALQDSNSNVAYFAATALAEVGEERVVKPLIRAMGSSSWPVRNAASTSLSLLGDLAIEHLVNSTEDEHEDVAFWVGKTLKRIGRGALPEVVRLLKKGSDEQRYYAAKALGGLRDPQAVEPLIEALTDGHEWVRLYAAIALGEIGGERALSHLLGVLRDPTFRIHPRMVEVFERFGDRVVPDLLEMARKGDISARSNAVVLLGSMRVASAFSLVSEIAQDDGAPRDLRVAAIRALSGYRGRSDVIAVLGVVATDEGEALLRTKAILALGEIDDDEAIPVLLKAMARSESREDQARALNLLAGQGPRIIPALIEALGHDEVGVRKASAEVLEKAGGAALPYLRTATLEKDQNVRFWAKKLLKRLENQVVES
jgi:HEAT repeat protein